MRSTGSGREGRDGGALQSDKEQRRLEREWQEGEGREPDTVNHDATYKVVIDEQGQ